MNEERRVLPKPATQADEYLYEMALSLRSMNVMIAQVAVEISALNVFDADTLAQADGAVDLREPDAPRKKRRHRDEA